MPAERLQKIIAAAGVASRRKARTESPPARAGQWSGGHELGTKADPEQDTSRGRKLLQGRNVSPTCAEQAKGYVTTVSDEKASTVMDSGAEGEGARVSRGRLTG